MERLIKDKFSIFVFVTSGFPTAEKTIDILLALQKSNVVDVVELGIPCSECVADGPVLESCGDQARKNGTDNIFKCLDILKEARNKGFNIFKFRICTGINFLSFMTFYLIYLLNYMHW